MDTNRTGTGFCIMVFDMWPRLVRLTVLSILFVAVFNVCTCDFDCRCCARPEACVCCAPGLIAPTVVMEFDAALSDELFAVVSSPASPAPARIDHPPRV